MFSTKDAFITQASSDWQEVMKEEIEKPYFTEIGRRLEHLSQLDKVIFPEIKDLFTAFKLTPFQHVKVVILGQDPYHGKGQAHGLAFSILDKKTPPSLKNIFKEIYSDFGVQCTSNDLSYWAKQGVFLLNTILTVEEGKPLSHKEMGWLRFTKQVILELDKKEEPIVFALWGKKAEQYTELIDTEKHKVIINSHPSPFSYRKNFEGKGVFKTINSLLYQDIDWKV